jgi:hypothetical protein
MSREKSWNLCSEKMKCVEKEKAQLKRMMDKRKKKNENKSEKQKKKQEEALEPFLKCAGDLLAETDDD